MASHPGDTPDAHRRAPRVDTAAGSAERPLSPEHQAVLLEVAERSIDAGLHTGAPWPPDPSTYPAPLQARRACFVTLRLGSALRGCMGGLEGVQPLVRDVSDKAFAAAFLDPRFPPLTPEAFPDLRLHLSVLSPLEPLRHHSEADVLSHLRPGVDGLVLQYGARRSTLLPAVWQDVPDPKTFLYHLKLKAGLPGDFWSEAIRLHRYTTQSFDRHVRLPAARQGEGPRGPDR